MRSASIVLILLAASLPATADSPALLTFEDPIGDDRQTTYVKHVTFFGVEATVCHDPSIDLRRVVVAREGDTLRLRAETEDFGSPPVCGVAPIVTHERARGVVFGLSTWDTALHGWFMAILHPLEDENGDWRVCTRLQAPSGVNVLDCSPAAMDGAYEATLPLVGVAEFDDGTTYEYDLNGREINLNVAAGSRAHSPLGEWQGTLVFDDVTSSFGRFRP